MHLVCMCQTHTSKVLPVTCCHCADSEQEQDRTYIHILAI